MHEVIICVQSSWVFLSKGKSDKGSIASNQCQIGLIFRIKWNYSAILIWNPSLLCEQTGTGLCENYFHFICLMSGTA